MNRKMIIVRTMLVVALIVLLYLYYSFQTANPYIILKGLVQISIGDERVEKISSKPLRYISKSYKDVVTYIKSEGYTIEGNTSDQFTLRIKKMKDEEYKFLTYRDFLGKYAIYSE